MSKSSYTNKTSDSKGYAAGYEVFLKRTNFRNVIIEKFKENLKSKKDLLEKNSNSFRILDIGCGNGAMTESLINSLLIVIPNKSLEIVLVEPASDALLEAAERLGKFSSNVKMINLTAEEYSKLLQKDDALFDLIIASYVFYHVSTDVIGPFADHLSSNGSMMISMGSYEHPLRKHPSLRSVSKHGDSNIVEDAFERLEIKKSFMIKKDVLKTDLKVSGLLNNDYEFNDEGIKFFSFIYNTDLNDFTSEQNIALKNTIKDSVTFAAGIVHPVHNMYWLDRSLS